MDQRSRKTKICKQSFVHKCLQVTWKHFLFSVQMKVPLAFYLNLFWHNGHPNLSLISILHIFHKSTTLSKSACSDAMAYVGLSFWITLETQNDVKDQIGGKVNLKWEQNTKRVNGMIPKDVKPSSSYPQIFYTIARKKNKQKEH